MFDLLNLYAFKPLAESFSGRLETTGLKEARSRFVETEPRALSWAGDVFSAGAHSSAPPTDTPSNPMTALKDLVEVTASVLPADSVKIITLTGPIIKESREKVVKSLIDAMKGYYKPDGTLDQQKLKDEPLHFFIDSFGGEIPESWHITETMENLKDRGLNIITYVHKRAASAGADIFAHGSERVMSRMAQILLHETQVGQAGMRPLHEATQSIQRASNINLLSNKDLHECLRKDAPKYPHDFEAFCKLLQTDQIYDAQGAMDIGLVDRIGVFDDIRPKPIKEPSSEKLASTLEVKPSDEPKAPPSDTDPTLIPEVPKVPDVVAA